MEWTSLLIEQQTDFIQRLKSGRNLHCEIEGYNSELTVISGNRLKKLRDFCWDMVKKYKPDDPKQYFNNNLKGKLGEEVLKSRLNDFVSEVDYEKHLYGDGKVDFTIASHPNFGIQVKARQGNINQVKWSISKEEVDKNTVLVCVLIQEEVNESQNEYNLISAGFLPTNMVKINNNSGVASFGINELLYCGGLYSYLKSLTSSKRVGYQNELTKYNSALEDLMLSILVKIIQHEDFIERVENIAASKVIGIAETTYDKCDGLIEGNVTYCEIDNSVFEIKHGDIYSLEWTIAFKNTGMAYIGYVTADGEDGGNPVSFSCKGNVEIMLPDYFRDELLTDISIEEIIGELVSSIKLQVEIHSVCFN
ncbi:hypothetical protein [Anabaena subtropica]|uniref:Restriction endonuclease n=1 Tax=Anabaena subtropica FACHB-260 TaxID=2692884 RepID=A0ABR8CRV4_9NOST|nr:hypothetical protein [Anabaena subtropica]MBD2345200.1 hypothetical protein [Anabaena subtropica FACHB-260]